MSQNTETWKWLTQDDMNEIFVFVSEWSTTTISRLPTSILKLGGQKERNHFVRKKGA